MDEILGYRFRDPELLRLALTHPSVSAQNNQRLEVLGDAVLGYLIADRLYRTRPGAQEGEMTRERLALVCEATLSDIAERNGIGECLIMQHGEEHTGGRHKPSVLCDAMEAILAAVYLDGGMDEARALVERCWPENGQIPAALTETKSDLQEYFQARHQPAPEYRLLGRTGPDHAPVFTVGVFENGTLMATASGNSKKAAEQEAALRAMQKLTSPEPPENA